MCCSSGGIGRRARLKIVWLLVMWVRVPPRAPYNKNKSILYTLLYFGGFMNIVFLDIDGVLQPHYAESRFYFTQEDFKGVAKRLFQQTGINYLQYDISDVLAVVYDWNPQAVARLKYILDSTESKIITSTDWKSDKYPNKMRDLLEIQGLGKYWYKDNIII